MVYSVFFFFLCRFYNLSPKTSNSTASCGHRLISQPKKRKITNQKGGKKKKYYQMHKLLQYGHGFLYSTFDSYHKNCKFLLPISHLHSFSKTLVPNSKLDFIVNEVEVVCSSKPTNRVAQIRSKTSKQADQTEPSERNESAVQISHPWPEWVELMELLLKRGYFEADGNPFRNGELGTKETNCIRTACLNFARDRFGLIR